MALYNVLFDLDSAVGDSGKKLAGVTVDAQNATAPESIVYDGSAIDQINAASVITPDILNLQWVQDIYNPLAGMALTLFELLLVAAAIMYLWSLMGANNHVNAEMLTFVKRCFIEFPAIYFGLNIFAWCLETNMLMSTVFGGSVSITRLLGAGFMSPSGLLVCLYAVGATLTAWFYLCRWYILIICIMLWAFGCVLRIFEPTRSIGITIFRVTLINIFLGTWMCICFAAGAKITSLGTGIVTSWGATIVGIVVMSLALWVPKKLWDAEIGNAFERAGKKAVVYAKMVV